MFSHYYVFEEDSHPDHPSPLVIEIECLDTEKLTELPSYLIDTVHLRYNIEGLDTHLEARPLQFELRGGKRISERGIWALILDQSDTLLSVPRYVDAVIDYRSQAEDLGFYSFLDVVGQDPLYALISRVNPEYLTEDPELLNQFIPATDCFLKFLRHCDMGHETYQDDYINIMLDFYMKHDAERMVDLLAFRLTNGQHTELGKGKVRYLLKRGVFKALVDKLIEMNCWNDGWSYGNLFVLCSAVYGKANDPIEEVIQYCSALQNLGERSLDRYAQRDSERLALYSDVIVAERVTYGAGVDTGFHQINKSNETWLSITS